MLPKAVLVAPTRGGARHHQQAALAMLRRCQRWLAGERIDLWEELRTWLQATRSTAESTTATQHSRCCALAAEGELSRACAALTKSAPLPPSQATFEQLSATLRAHCLTSLAPQADLSAFLPSFQVRRPGMFDLEGGQMLGSWLRCRTLRLGSNFFAIAFPSQKWCTACEPLLRGLMPLRWRLSTNNTVGAWNTWGVSLSQTELGTKLLLVLSKAASGCGSALSMPRLLTWHPWPPPMKLAGASMVGTRLIGLLLCRRRLRLMLPSLLPTVSMEFTNPGSKPCRRPWTRPSLLSFRCRPKENPSGHTFNFFNNRAPGRGCWPGLRKPLGFTWMLPFFACFSACGSVFPSQALMAIAPCATGSRTASGIMLGRALAAAIARSATTASGRSSLLGLWPLDSALRSRNKACCLNGRRNMGLVNLAVAATRHSDGRLMFTSLHGGPMGQQLLISPPRVACEAQCFPPPLRVVGLLPPTTKGESEPIRTRSSTATAKASSSCLLWLKLAVVGGAPLLLPLGKNLGRCMELASG